MDRMHSAQHCCPVAVRGRLECLQVTPLCSLLFGKTLTKKTQKRAATVNWIEEKTHANNKNCTMPPWIMRDAHIHRNAVRFFSMRKPAENGRYKKVPKSHVWSERAYTRNNGIITKETMRTHRSTRTHLRSMQRRRQLARQVSVEFGFGKRRLHTSGI